MSRPKIERIELHNFVADKSDWWCRDKDVRNLEEYCDKQTKRIEELEARIYGGEK